MPMNVIKVQYGNTEQTKFEFDYQVRCDFFQFLERNQSSDSAGGSWTRSDSECAFLFRNPVKYKPRDQLEWGKTFGRFRENDAPHAKVPFWHLFLNGIFAFWVDGRYLDNERVLPERHSIAARTPLQIGLRVHDDWTQRSAENSRISTWAVG